MFVVSAVWTATLDCLRRAFAIRCSMSCLVSLKGEAAAHALPGAERAPFKSYLCNPVFLHGRHG
jgi:hypothetical protein